jgi:hypothetical protein
VTVRTVINNFTFDGSQTDQSRSRSAMLPAACGRIAAGSRRIPTETTS